MRMSFQNTARPFIIAIPKASSSSDEEPKAAHPEQNSGDLSQVWLTSRHLLAHLCLPGKRCTYHLGSS